MRKDKEWAIITGASSGIGKALALEFAEKEFNVFLTGRNILDLKKVAGECKNKFHVEQLDGVKKGTVAELIYNPEERSWYVGNGVDMVKAAHFNLGNIEFYGANGEITSVDASLINKRTTAQLLCGTAM
ncbi:MAG: SDR family NAD(P)-dependent oxidoreductase [Bacteroidetes bacterium]|nr:SDR family NAD(P)-dependent oxidoreductase [Bacteroidota bacterium]